MDKQLVINALKSLIDRVEKDEITVGNILYSRPRQEMAVHEWHGTRQFEPGPDTFITFHLVGA